MTIAAREEVERKLHSIGSRVCGTFEETVTNGATEHPEAFAKVFAGRTAEQILTEMNQPVEQPAKCSEFRTMCEKDACKVCDIFLERTDDCETCRCLTCCEEMWQNDKDDDAREVKRRELDDMGYEETQRRYAELAAQIDAIHAIQDAKKKNGSSESTEKEPEPQENSPDGEPCIYEFEPVISEKVGTLGLYKDGTIRRISQGEGDKKWHKWVSDCAMFIHTDTKSLNGVSEFTFVGRGAIDDRPVRFTMLATECASEQTFKGKILNEFGAKNLVGKLTFEMVQKMSIGTVVRERVEVPYWKGNIPMVPGVDLVKNVEYRLHPAIPALVYNGDIKLAIDEIRRLLQFHKFSPVVVCAVLGSIAVARWFPELRFFLAIWGITGTWKTTFILLSIAVYGIKYAEKPTLKANNNGSTPVGAMETFVLTGILPLNYDNVKAINQKSGDNYISVVQMVCEGDNKARGAKDGGLREAEHFQTTPFVTGEIRPAEASTTARGLNIWWDEVDADLPVLNEIQKHKETLPTVGYHWLRWLAGTKEVLCPDFGTVRSKITTDLRSKGYTNPGRSATISTLMLGVWTMLEHSPFGEVFLEFHDKFVNGLDEVAKLNAAAVTEETEVVKFIDALQEIIATNPQIILGTAPEPLLDKSALDVPVGGRIKVKPIGKWLDDGIFLLPDSTLKEVFALKVFTQMPTISSLNQALDAKGWLINARTRDPKSPDTHLQDQVRFGGGKPRGWHIKTEALLGVEPTT